MKWTAGKSLTQNFYRNEKGEQDNERENLRCPDRNGIRSGWRLLSASLETATDSSDWPLGERYEALIEQLSQREGVSEKLKEENQMEWVRCMKNLENRAAEIVKAELIYTFEGR